MKKQCRENTGGEKPQRRKDQRGKDLAGINTKGKDQPRKERGRKERRGKDLAPSPAAYVKTALHLHGEVFM